MKSRPVNRYLAGLLVASVLLVPAACAGGDSASLGEPVQLRFRMVMEDPYPAETAEQKPPKTTVDELDPEAVFDKVGDEAAETAAGLSATPTDAATLEKLEPFADLSPEEVAVLPPKLGFFVPGIGCPQLAGDVEADDDEMLALCDKDGQKYLLDKADIGNSHVKSAEAERSPTGSGHQVKVSFTEAGAKVWLKLTAKASGKQVAILVDGEILAAPVIQMTITGGLAVIAGEFSKAEAERLAAGIEAGTK